MKPRFSFPKSIPSILIFTLLIQFSSCVTVQPGYRGIRVYLSDEKDKSGDIEVLGVGRYLIISFSKRVYTFPVFQQNYVWAKSNEEGDRSISFQTVEGLSVNGDFGISYSIIPDSVATIFQRYRRGIDEITDIFLRNMVRDALNSEASQMTMEDVYGKSRQALLKRVESSVADQVKSVGIVIDRIYSVGEFRLPPQVVNAINSKIEATQRSQQRENEVRLAEAEASIRIAKQKGESESKLIEAKADAEARIIRAKADSAANFLRSKSISPQLIMIETINRWNGALPLVSGQASPFLNFDELIRTAQDTTKKKR